MSLTQNQENIISSPTEMMQMFRAFQISRILLTGYELDVFSIIDKEPLSAMNISESLGANQKGTERLMNALTALGYVIKRDNLYSNTPLTSKFLVKSKPNYMAGLGHVNNLWKTWNGLTETILNGEASHKTQINDREPNWLRNFIFAMHSRGIAKAIQIENMINFSGVKKILDVGGGSGVFASTFVSKNEGITAVVFDLPNVIPITQEFIDKEQIQDRVSTLTGNYLVDNIGSGYDLVFLCAIIHSNSDSENRLLIKKCYESLNSGGQIVIVDFVMNNERTEPAGGTIFAINMLVGTEKGDTYTKDEIFSWVSDAGFDDLEIKNTTDDDSIVYGQEVPDKEGPKKFACPVQNADPEVRLSVMDKYGVNVQAVSLTMESLDGFDAETAADVCRRANSDNYTLCKAYPDRFVNICAISLLDVNRGLKELDRSINELDCRGVTVATNQNGKGLDSPEYFPFYEKLTKHDLPMLLHPTNWKSYPLADESQWMFMSRFGWPFDTTQAVWHLIFGGVLDRFPSLKIVMHHLGALLPYFAGRIQFGLARLQENLPRDMSEYWKNIYGDSALSGGPQEAYACGYAFFGPDRVLYGSDYPFGPEAGERFVRDNMAGLTSLKIPAGDMQKILGENAKRLLKIDSPGESI